MSIINRVLKDLDQKGTSPTPLSGVQAIQTSLEPTRPRWPWVFALLIGGLGAAWWFWLAAKPEALVTPSTPHETTPHLRLSETLSSPELPSPTGVSSDLAAVVGQPSRVLSSSIRGAGGEGATVDTSANTQSAPPEPTKPEPTRALQHGSHNNADDAAPIRAPSTIAARLDTRLPEPRQSKVIKEIRALTPREQAEQAWRQAAHLIERGRGHDALEGLEAALRLDPNHGQALQTLIALSLETGDMARGETLLREGMQLHANDAWYNRALSQLYLQRGDLPQSAATLKAGLGKSPDAAYWGLYAGILGKSGHPEEAALAYREAARLNPNHGPWWIGLAVSLEKTGQRPDAAAVYQRALQTRLDTEVREFAAKKAADLAR